MSPEPSASPTASSSTHVAAILSPGGAWLILIICAFISLGIMAYAYYRKKETNFFYYWVAVIALFGGALAFFLPIAIDSGFAKDDDGSRLRQSLLYTVGGLLGVITLGETHRKNNQEKIKNEQEKYKNDQDHTRQVHAERRSRYTKAVEQLADDNAAVRLGGVYTLFGLADEWLADKLIEKSTQLEESQTIINNLCAYIRTPLSAEEKGEILEYSSLEEYSSLKNLYMTKKINFPDILKEEQGIRRTIMKEIKKRTITYLSVTNRTNWSDFYFDFSDSTFFYDVDLSMCKFNNGILFSNSLFIEAAIFTRTDFHYSADFSNATFKNMASFMGASQKGFGDFNFTGAQFNSGNFYSIEIEGIAKFSRAEFNMDPNFSESIFHGPAFFNGISFKRSADFSGSAFCEKAFFQYTTFGKDKEPIPSLDEINFSNTTFIEETDFSGAEFYYPTNFSSASFYESSPIFKKASFLGSTKHLPILLQEPIKHIFSASNSSPFCITTEHHLSPYGDSHFIPTGADIFIIENKKQQKGKNKKEQAKKKKPKKHKNKNK